MSPGVCRDNEMSFLREIIGMWGDGKRRSITSVCEGGSAAMDAKAAQVACMRLGGENGMKEGSYCKAMREINRTCHELTGGVVPRVRR
jgi:hypothetical protein